MNRNPIFLAVAAGAILLSGCMSSSMHGGMMTRGDTRTMISGWPESAHKAALMMMDKYGPPAEVTATMLVWNNTGPWKRSIVYRDEIQHDFPMPHKDVWEQFVDYRVPVGKFDELARYDGSVIVERTKGEMSARCDKEAANFLALNLANEIITGKRSVEDARRFYADTIKAMMNGQMSPYLQGLLFTPAGMTADPDHAPSLDH